MATSASIPTEPTSTESASETIASVAASTDVASEELDDKTPSEEVATEMDEISPLESPASDPLSTEVTDIEPEVPLVEVQNVESEPELGLCHRFLRSLRGISLKLLCTIMIVASIVFGLVLATVLTNSQIVLLVTLGVIVLIVVVLMVFLFNKLIQEWVTNCRRDRQTADARTSDQERGSSTLSGASPRSATAERNSEPVVSSFESETSSPQTASKSPSRQERAGPTLVEESVSERAGPSNVGEEESVSEISAKSEDELLRDKESVRQRHKSSEGTE